MKCILNCKTCRRNKSLAEPSLPPRCRPRRQMLTAEIRRGMANSMDGQNSVLSVVGPLSQSVASLRLLIKSLLTQQPWLHDPLCNEIPWRQDHEDQITDLISSSRLAFGILRHDGVATPHPPVQRALDMVVETLKRLGHEANTNKQVPSITIG